MLAAVRRTQEGKGFVVEDHPKPKIGDTDVLVRLEATGLCGTDIQIWNGTYMGRSGPVIPPLDPRIRIRWHCRGWGIERMVTFCFRIQGVIK
jgi:NADPH:quinone reductase-like Zn-dependent oxidoreductase